ncbi:hypothetical protein FLJC2902T_29650 [Flavobacterium limnosediminis JC2902]|uniref:Uncharacterized protein n=1 Tax=Flavobacterium limnosediminis JC2902 TaxID=1341181 RepID=V6SHM1_9FLAO|nr:hypothetical protein [Flavobacterium limnosediminis]ESU25954.1 hypothetical protein FLJC2902T_29650 [Flavobacterium limnosediminis JC2902]
MIKKFVIRTLIVGVIFFGILIVVLLATSQYVERKGFRNSQTESNTLVIESNREYDLMFMGISHARNFSRHGNHEVVESILNKKIINIGQGGGACGINEQLFYLDYFYSKGNKVDTVFFILTPPMLTSEKLPFSSNTFDSELFDLKFFCQYLSFDSENKYERIVQYMQSKLKSKWVNSEPNHTIGKKDSLVEVDMEAVRKGMQLVHGRNINVERFTKSCIGVEKIIKTAKKHNSFIVMIIPPALFGKWPEHNLVVNFAQKLKKKQGVDFYDFSESVLIPKYYYDHHHMNTKGVEYFTAVFLKPLL